MAHQEWEKACMAYENNDMDTAIGQFTNIRGINSKIYFNIGIILTEIGKYDSAIESYLQALKLDPYMAVARFQLGVVYFLKGNMKPAVENFDQAYEKMRRNKIIDYQQLGLPFLLYSCEVLFNRGICQLYLGKVDAGLTDLYYAQKVCVTAEHSIIEHAIRDQGRGYTIFSIPPGVLFKPRDQPYRLLHVDKSLTTLKQPILTRKGQSNSILLKNKPDNIKTLQASPLSIPNRFSSRKSNTQGNLSLLAKSDFFQSADSGFESTNEDKQPHLPALGVRGKSAYSLATDLDEGYGDFDRELEEVYGSLNTLSLNTERQWDQQNWVLSGEKMAYSSSNRKIKVKVHYNDTRILLVSSSILFKELRARIEEKFNIPNATLLKYRDEESELVLLVDDDDLQIARQVCRQADTKTDMEKIELWCFDK
ncbi:hypothetical protein BY458DRAFT_500871 [Sporodiniella umbellata]|nr:hypothetical protein BY458DRAFT_500871 [Sporodiniella umbellata]